MGKVEKDAKACTKGVDGIKKERAFEEDIDVDRNMTYYFELGGVE